MTQPKKRRVKKGAVELTDDLKTILFYGNLLSGLPTFEEGYLKSVWELNDDTLVKEFVKERPGTRPWAFWRFSAPEEKRRCLGETTWPAPTFGRTKDKLLTAPVWESDFVYLRRCGELLAGEEARAKVAFSDSLEIRDKKIHEHAEKKHNLHKGSLFAESTDLNSI